MAQKKEEFQKFAARGPELTVLTDHALKPEETYRDSFNLRYRLGPVYDILRYPDTKTPMAIAVYGDWGAGKTTAMKWLHGLIDEWNENGKTEGRIKIKPVWFYPWKYDKKEDVWRGLIAEVILNAMGEEVKDAQTAIRAFKMLSIFVGKSAIDIVSAAKFGVPGFAKLDSSVIKKIIKNFKEAVHPEDAYLHPYENALEKWIQETLGEKQRMVIFIDDLDRCMPEIALQVLESLKLYLKIEKLIFVVGVDKTVIDKLVREHYKQLGLDEEKSGNYLAKMFQVEVQVEPSEQQISDFLDEQLKEISYWREPHLSEDERDIFRELIYKLAERNPREVKRLINSALMMGAGAVMMKAPEGKQSGIKFNQGLQLFFVRKVLDDRYTMGSEVGSKRGIEFFGQWSQIVCEGREKDKDFQCSIRVPKDYYEQFSEAQLDKREGRLEEVSEKMKRRAALEKPSFAPPEYHPLLQNPRFSVLLHLLGDEDLGELMRIPYPTEAEAAEIAAVVGTSKDADIIREAIARKLGKKTDELTDEDYTKITALHLTGSEISDLEPIMWLSNLQEIRLRGTQVSNLEPIKRLWSLERLDLSYTQVSDLEPIKGLSSLQWINLNNTKVSDLEPIKGLSSLKELYFNETQISDLKPIKGLNSLQWIHLNDTQVSDLEPTKGLVNLQELHLIRTHVSDLEPIKGLSSLKWLDLIGTQVSDLDPIRGLSSLIRLHLDNTKVRDLEPIKGLSSLQGLSLTGTKVTKKQVEELQKELPELLIVR